MSLPTDIKKSEFDIAIVMNDEIPCPHCGSHAPMYDARRWGNVYRALWFDMVFCAACNGPVLVFYHAGQVDFPESCRATLKWKYDADQTGSVKDGPDPIYHIN